jgi:hypothetical protein
MTTVDTDELVAWLRQAIEDQHAQLVNDVDELAGWVDEAGRWRGEELKAVLLAEVEAKRLRLLLLSALANDQPPISVLAGNLLKIEAHPLASRPGFRDDWRLT